MSTRFPQDGHTGFLHNRARKADFPHGINTRTGLHNDKAAHTESHCVEGSTPGILEDRRPQPVFRPFDMKNGKDFYLYAYADTWRIAHGDLRGFVGEDYWRMARYRTARDPRSVLGMYREGQLIGVLAVDPEHGKTEGALWISFAWLSEEMRGQGLGRTLFMEAERLAWEMGRKELQLCVAENNPAVGFYDALGFTVCGTEPGALEPLLKLHKSVI